MRVAGIDCGTNSVRLLVADIVDGRLIDVHREMRVVRLGAGVDRTGRLDPAAIERTRVALVDYAAIARGKRAERIRLVATSATRDAANRDDFAAVVRDTLGVDPDVITGDEEAALSFAGAIGSLPDLPAPVLVADIGGGSTELVLHGTTARSVDVGCVRMTERHLHDDPPTKAQQDAVVDDVRAAFEGFPLTEAATVVGVAGTVTTVAAIALDLTVYDAAAIHGTSVSAAAVADVTRRLAAMTHAERAAVPVMHPGRVDVIVGGALVLRTLLELSGAGAVIASEHDILDGIALSLVRPAG